MVEEELFRVDTRSKHTLKFEKFLKNPMKLKIILRHPQISQCHGIVRFDFVLGYSYTQKKSAQQRNQQHCQNVVYLTLPLMTNMTEGQMAFDKIL